MNIWTAHENDDDNNGGSRETRTDQHNEYKKSQKFNITKDSWRPFSLQQFFFSHIGTDIRRQAKAAIQPAKAFVD